MEDRRESIQKDFRERIKDRHGQKRIAGQIADRDEDVYLILIVFHAL